ncbi:hypothetical protein WJX84_006618 [Apatococcus fuscideae]|uniref:Uncharacterized protein n=1 Tax=Apatococcus fuscideae TaxID=2026836 RepID=A0AAW1SLY3_9CHLO
MSDSEPDSPRTPPSRSKLEPGVCPPAPRKLRPTKTWEGSRDCRAVRRLDFTAGRPSLQLDFAEAASTSVPDAAVPATALLQTSPPLPSLSPANFRASKPTRPSGKSTAFLAGPKRGLL